MEMLRTPSIVDGNQRLGSHHFISGVAFRSPAVKDIITTLGGK